ncbi:MAG: DegV family protein [Bulleidia sp.]
MKLAFVTDSGTGRSISDHARDGIVSLPLQISDEKTTYQDLETLSVPDMIALLREGHTFTTSQPSYGLIEECFESLKKEGTDLILAVPICNGLSGTISSMTAIAENLGLKIICIDCYVTAVVQEYLIQRIKACCEAGMDQLDIRVLVEKIIDSTNTLIIPETLDQLIRGGRLTPLAAKMGKLLKIAPVLQINKKTSGKIDTLQKVRTFRKALNKAMEQMEYDHVNDGDNWSITIAHVDNLTTAQSLREQMRETFPNADIDIIPLCSPVAAHTGHGSICIQYFRKY